jgi:hypothetical protein
MGIPPSRIEVRPPGVDVPAVGAANNEPARVLFVGRLETHQGVLGALLPLFRQHLRY